MNLLQAIVASFIASVGLWLVVRSLMIGVISGEDGLRISRAESPLRFWGEILAGVSVVVGCTVFTLWKLELL